MDDTPLPQPKTSTDNAGTGAADMSSRTDASGGRAPWITVLLVRVGTLAAAALLLQMSGSAAWDAHVLGLRGDLRPATVLDVTQTSWGKADRATIAIAGVGAPGPAQVTTPRKDLDVGDAVEAIVDPREPHRAALAGDGWPWRQVLIPLWGLPLVALFGVRYGRWRKEPASPVREGGADHDA